jgi:alkaline phosphatase
MPHATPAAWSAHSSARSVYDFIAQQQIEADPPLDVMLGGGRRYFDSRRADGRNLLHEHQERYTIVHDALQLRREAARGLDKPLLGLFSDEDMDYEVDRLHMPPPLGGGAAGGNGNDRNGKGLQPSLSEMVSYSQKTLSHDCYTRILRGH